MTTRSPYAHALQSGTLPIGTVISERYLITRFIGKGGFALVYEAFDRTIGRSVAVKVLKGFADEQLTPKEAGILLGRFELEAKAAAKIAHPNVVSVFEMGVLDDTKQPYIIMEYLEGCDLLKKLAPRMPMEASWVLPLFCRALSALAAGHQKNIIHKDLKPANLFLVNPGGEEEDIRVLDFGIAAATDMGARLTATGFMSGTPEYLAPEYIEDQSVSPAVDVYQMGLILVEMLTGKVVVTGGTPLACLALHLDSRLLIAEALLDCAPMRPILLRALARDPAARYEHAGAFLADLQMVDPASLPTIAPDAPQILLREYLIDHHLPTGPLLHPPESYDAHDAAVADTVLSMQAPFPPPSKGVNKKTILMVMGLVGAFVVGVVGFIVAALLLQESPPPPPRDKVVAEKPVEVPDEPKAPSKVPTIAPEVPVVEAPPSKPIEVEIVTVPSKAKVFRADKLLGATPLTLTFENRDEGAMELVIKRRNYKDTSLQLGPDDGPRKDVILDRAARKPARSGGMGLAQ